MEERTSSYLARIASASARFFSLDLVTSTMASIYFSKVGDNGLEIGEFSIDITPFGRLGFVKARYRATFAPLAINPEHLDKIDTWNVQQ